MENTVVSLIPLHELESKFAAVVEEKLRNILLQNAPKEKSNASPYLTRKEVSSLLRISLPTLHELTKDEVLIAYHIKGRVLYKSEEVHAALSHVSITKYKRKSFLNEIPGPGFKKMTKPSNSNSKKN